MHKHIHQFLLILTINHRMQLSFPFPLLQQGLPSLYTAAHISDHQPKNHTKLLTVKTFKGRKSKVLSLYWLCLQSNGFDAATQISFHFISFYFFHFTIYHHHHHHHYHQVPSTSSRSAIIDLQLFWSSALLTHPL